MGLKLVLKANERVVINGAVLNNPSNQKMELVVENKSTILRERDFMREDEATTPCRRLYYLGVLTILDEENLEKHRGDFLSWLGEIMAALRNPIAIAAAAEIGQEIAQGNFYRVLKGCRTLIDYEDIALGRKATEAEVPAKPVAESPLL